ncbi:DUF5994 family protein [Streptomyces sp. NPDC054765]
MTVTVGRTTAPSRERVPSPPARVALTPANALPGLLDGAWWPRSFDLSRELRALSELLDTRWGRITRVTVNPAHWPVIPRKVSVNGHTVHVGWFAAEQDPHKLLLFSYTVGRWDLLVVPPTTDAAAAARLMSAATVPGNVRTASQLLADEITARDASETRSREEEWETEGGSAAPASGNPTGFPSPALGRRA